MSENTSIATSEITNKPRRSRHRIRPSNSFTPFDKKAINGSVPARFEVQVRQYADKVAVQFADETWTYTRLNRKANRVARALLTHQQESERAVALLFGQGAAVISAMLGALKAGEFYVPLDASYPRARMTYMLEDAQAKVILTDSVHLSLAHELARGHCDVINVDELGAQYSDQNLALPIAPDTLAYILYTSGSSGQPKGVVHSHRNVLHLIWTATNRRRFCAQDRVSLLASLSFSASVPYIYSALLNGATLCPYDIKKRGLAPLADWLRQQEITVYQSTPTVFRYLGQNLSERDVFPAVRLVTLGGEAVLKQDVELFRKHFPPHCLFRVGYAATETGTIAEDYIDQQTEVHDSVVPPRHIVEDVEVLLWNENGPVGANDVGEIVIKSNYLALGYWQRPELTQAAFLPDPDGGDVRLYRTGDLGQILPDGTLVHLGRKDRQVKIRGQRVETAEIEAALHDLEAVERAAVLARDHPSGDKRLVAYVVPSDQRRPTVSALSSLLSKRLPDYMLPSAFVMLDDLPLTPTGKVDRRALPAPNTARPDLNTPLVAPRTPVEETLAKMWAEVLGLDEVGVLDSFVELGGHSLLATQVISRVLDTFRVSLPLESLLQAPTVAEMAVTITQNLAKEIEDKEMIHLLAELEKQE